MKKLLIASLLLVSSFSPVSAAPYLDIQTVETKSGVAAWMVRDKTIPLWNLHFSIKGGAQFDTDGKEGLVSLLASTIDEGAGKNNAEQVQNMLDAHGIRMQFSASRDRFTGVLRTTVLHQDVAIGLLDDALNRPRFDADSVTRIKRAMQSNHGFQQMQPSWHASKLLFETLFPDHAYARLVEGDNASIARLGSDDLRAIKGDILCKDRLKIAIVGDMTPAQAGQIVDRVFGKWPACKTALPPQIKPKNLGKRVDKTWQSTQSVVLAAQPGLPRSDKDWWAARILDFALGGGEFSSRLMDEIRVKRGMTYGIGTSLATYDLSPLWIVQSGIEATKTDEAIDLIKKIWADVAENGLTDAEIAEAKSYLIDTLPLALTSTSQIANIVLQLQEDDLPKDTLDRREAEIGAVTAHDIKRVAAERLHKDQLTFIVVGPTPSKNKQEEKKK